MALPQFLGPCCRCLDSIPLVDSSVLRVYEFLAKCQPLESVEGRCTSVRIYFYPEILMLTLWSRRLPIGTLAVVVMGSSGQLSGKISPKWVTLFGEALVMIATIILPFADRPSRYWSFAFPAFCLGTTGTSLIYTHAK